MPQHLEKEEEREGRTVAVVLFSTHNASIFCIDFFPGKCSVLSYVAPTAMTRLVSVVSGRYTEPK